MRSLHENKNNHTNRSNNSMIKQPLMSYERAYKEIYETFVLWLVEFKQMKPDKDFSEDRIDGALTSLASIVAEMEDYKPEIKIIREEIETWGKDLKGDKNESRNKNARRNTETDSGQW